jgi:hypothetical protein
MPSSKSSKAVPRLPAKPEVAAPSTSRDLAEEAGDWFEEASDHAQAGERFSGLELGPVVSIAPSDLRPGTYGWRRSVRGPSTPASAASTLYFLVPNPGPARKGPSPLRAYGWSEFAAAAPSGGSPNGIVLARGGPASSSSLLSAYVKAVAAELERDDE